MTARHVRLVLVLAAACGLVACGSSVPAGLGESCSASHGCADGLTCHAGTCVSVGGSDGGTVSDGGTADGGTKPDGGTTDGGTVTDGGTSDGGSNDGGTVGDGGTTDGGTTDGGTACGPCNTPPDVCHATQGTCENGACVYAVVDGAACDDGNPCTVQDTCNGGTCAGTPMVCDTPPAAACLSATQLSTYDQTGVCSGGRCTYTKKTITCGSGGCVNNACQTDPCATMTCNTPPSTCYTSAGTCSNGSCTYPYADGTTCNDNDPCTTGDTCNTGVCKGQPIACNNPPASSCTGANTAKIYDSVGACSAGTCSYTYHFVTCATGCANGMCNASGWTKMVSNTNAHLWAVWGSSATDVWAGGDTGTMAHYDGSQWKLISSGTNLAIHAFDGTSSTDVWAVAATGSGASLLHYDGTSWSTVIATLAVSGDDPVSVHALGAGDVLVGGLYASGYDPEIIEVKNGTATLLAKANANAFNQVLGVWGTSATDVYLGAGYLYHWDGTTLGTVTFPTPSGAYSIWASGANDMFVGTASNVQYYDGTSWRLLNTGLTGTLTDLSGTASNRVFASAYQYFSSTGTYTGYVLAWDGSGWTQATIPSGTGELDGVFAAANGEVFVVGASGTILHGP